MDTIPDKYEAATLTNGLVLHNVNLCRAQGYDTRLFVTDGEYYAPMDSVVVLKK